MNGRLEGTYQLHLQGQKSAELETSVQHVVKQNFYPKERGDTFLSNINSHTDYRVPYPRRGQHRNYRYENLRSYKL
jgi:hypothetical protein